VVSIELNFEKSQLKKNLFRLFGKKTIIQTFFISFRPTFGSARILYFSSSSSYIDPTEAKKSAFSEEKK
jgi:hypothetical protein